MKKRHILLLTSSLLLLTGTASAADVPPLDKADNAFLLICAALVFLMQAGFCLVEMGFSRAKNSINIIMKNMCDMAAGSIGYFLVGFSLMFGWSQGGFVRNLGNFAFDLRALVPVTPFGFSSLFQMMFAAAALRPFHPVRWRNELISRVTYSMPSLVVELFTPSLATGSGVDSAGCPLVSAAAKAGCMPWDSATSPVPQSFTPLVEPFALAGIIVIGPRKGRFLEDGSPNCSPVTTCLWLLWECFFSSSVGSDLTADRS